MHKIKVATIVTGRKRLGRIIPMIAIIAFILVANIFFPKQVVDSKNLIATTTDAGIVHTASTCTIAIKPISFAITEAVISATEPAINTEVGTAPAVIASLPAIESATKSNVTQKPKATKKSKTANRIKKDKKSKKSNKKKKEYISLKEYIKGMSLDMRVDKPSGLSKKDFIKLLSGLKARILKKHPEIPPDPKGLYKKEAAFIWELGQEYQVDEIFLTALTGKEGAWFGFPLALKRNNFTGQMENGKLRTYKSIRKGLKATAENLRKHYLRTLKTLYKINTLYCEPNEKGEYTWYTEVYGCMKTITGK